MEEEVVLGIRTLVMIERHLVSEVLPRENTLHVAKIVVNRRVLCHGCDFRAHHPEIRFLQLHRVL